MESFPNCTNLIRLRLGDYRLSQQPRDFDELEFSIEEERWNEYELNDGARVQGRVVLTKILRDLTIPIILGLNFQNRCGLYMHQQH